MLIFSIDRVAMLWKTMITVSASVTLIAMLSFIAALKVTAADEIAALAPGYGALKFSAPAPGSYELPVLQPAADGQVLDSDGTRVVLHDLFGEKITLLSFIYSTCTDINGCPLATAVFYKLKRRISDQPDLAKHLRLLTISFNPLHDTPAVMKQYGQGLRDGKLDWRFLTAASEVELLPILEKYQQPIQKRFNEHGQFTGTFSHVLRVFLIDRKKRIRNIYSVSFLHADILINDIKTLLDFDSVDGSGNLADAKLIDRSDLDPLFRAGDDKRNYTSQNYRTESIALTERVGTPADLFAYATTAILGLPPIKVPEHNLLSPETIKLGRTLFYDRRLSVNNTFSCATCHIPEQGFTSNELATPIGVEGRSVRRNTPTLYNIAYASSLFHDGRESSLERQIWGPLLAHNEMANPSMGFVVDKLKTIDDYRRLFQAAFGEDPNIMNIGKAIANYQRTLNSGNSPFDRWRYGGVENAISGSAQRGFKLFREKAGCAGCHLIGKDSAVFTDNKFHNTGLGFRKSMGDKSTTLRVQVSPGVFLNVDSTAVRSVSEPPVNDLGRYEITGLPEDRWKYKTPSLRNIALTAPYMHDGSLQTLTNVIMFYNQGGFVHDNLDPLISPLSLSQDEIEDIVAFLKSLTGDNVGALVSDAYAAKIGVAD